MKHLFRGQAPITDGAWGLLDDEGRHGPAPALAGGKLGGFRGALGGVAVHRARIVAARPAASNRAGQKDRHTGKKEV